MFFFLLLVLCSSPVSSTCYHPIPRPIFQVSYLFRVKDNRDLDEVVGFLAGRPVQIKDLFHLLNSIRSSSSTARKESTICSGSTRMQNFELLLRHHVCGTTDQGAEKVRETQCVQTCFVWESHGVQSGTNAAWSLQLRRPEKIKSLPLLSPLVF
jgi:hypothetical protein